MARNTTLIKSLTPKHMAPKRILGENADVTRVILGTVMGIAVDASKQTLDNGDELKGLRGQFVFLSDDEEKAPSVRAGIFWPPEGFCGDIVHAMDKPKAERPDMIEFGFKFGVMRADNPAGYSLFAEPLIQASEVDPLTALANRLGATLPGAEPAAPALENKSEPAEKAKAKPETAKA